VDFTAGKCNTISTNAIETEAKIKQLVLKVVSVKVIRFLLK